MPDPREKTLRSATRYTGQSSDHKAIFASTFLFALVSVSVSTGLVVYTAWHHDLKNGLFALAFAVLSAKAALSWILWHDSDQQKIDS